MKGILMTFIVGVVLVATPLWAKQLLGIVH